jgi:hypothetical protein
MNGNKMSRKWASIAFANEALIQGEYLAIKSGHIRREQQNPGPARNSD